jgi:glycosyltransferase involved in cell wall biosynthesis
MAQISVVIPTCDRPDTLIEAVNCVLGQSYSAREIIVVNNGGQPLEGQLLPPPVKVYELQPYVGVSHARNLGVEEASGDYVAFLGDDDLWESDYLKKAAAVVEEHHPDCIITRLDKLVDGKVYPHKNADGKLDLATLLVTNPGSSGSSTIVRRDAFTQVSGYDLELKNGQDKALIIDFLINKYSVVTAPHIQAILREHAGLRLRNASSKAGSVYRFVQKYAKLMSPPQKNFNLVRFYYHRYLIERRPFDYFQYWIRFLLHRFYCKVNPALPAAPKLRFSNLLENSKQALQR